MPFLSQIYSYSTIDNFSFSTSFCNHVRFINTFPIRFAKFHFQRCKKKKKEKSNLLHKTQSIRSTYFLVHLLNGHDGSAFVITTNKMFNQYAFFHCECTWNVCVNFLHFSPRHENVRLEKKKKKWKNNTKVFVLRDSIVRDLFFDVKHRFVIRPLLLENNILQYTAIQ